MRPEFGRKISFLVIFLFFGCNGLHVSYNGDQIWRFHAQTDVESVSVEGLLRNHGFDIWDVKRRALDFRVPQNVVSEMVQLWQERGISYEVLIDDVGKLIENEKKMREEKASQDESHFSFDQYHTLDEIFRYLDDLSERSNLVTAEEIGRTHQGREIRLMKLSSPNGARVKPAVWVDCGIHAREWITPATCLWGLNYLTSQYSVDDTVTAFLDNHDIFMVPVLNADGYDYTWSDDRMWRKNRMQYSSNECTGVDLNRNYNDGHWAVIGASNYSCDETYHGPKPFSESETSAVRSKVLSIQETQTVKAFFSIHSYGQLWLFTFGWTDDLPSEVDELYRVSDVGVDAITTVNGFVYTNGPHYATIYPAAGTSVDWGYSVGIVHSYIIEVRDTGEYGFLLPQDQILPTATEVWTGLTAAINAI